MFTDQCREHAVFSADKTIQIFRVTEDSAYARPVAGTKLPRFTKLFARSF